MAVLCNSESLIVFEFSDNLSAENYLRILESRESRLYGISPWMSASRKRTCDQENIFRVGTSFSFLLLDFN